LPRLTEGNDPLLSVSLDPGETINAVSRAMVKMNMAVTITGKLQGGIIRSLIRKNTQGESLFLQEISAPSYPGHVLLAPSLPGDIFTVDLDQNEDLFINDGCYLASTSSIDLTSTIQSAGKAFFGGTGGFVIMRARGPGTVAISGFGSIIPIKLKCEEIICDHRHVVSWSSSIKYQVSTLRSNKGSLLSGIFNSLTSGEGLVNKFSGTGEIKISSRNRDDLMTWIQRESRRQCSKQKDTEYN